MPKPFHMRADWVYAHMQYSLLRQDHSNYLGSCDLIIKWSRPWQPSVDTRARRSWFGLWSFTFYEIILFYVQDSPSYMSTQVRIIALNIKSINTENSWCHKTRNQNYNQAISVSALSVYVGLSLIRSEVLLFHHPVYVH